MFGLSVMTFGMYVLSGNSPGRPTAFHGWSTFSKTGPRAKASAGRTKADAATAPATFADPTMKRRRVTVSPSYAPGISRSAVYFDLGSLRSAILGAERYRAASLRWPAARGFMEVSAAAPGRPRARARPRAAPSRPPDRPGARRPSRLSAPRRS